MLILTCPFCGDRNESEFACGGPDRGRRETALEADDAGWSDYLTVTPNPKGPVRERWRHRLGCGRWFVVERDTVTHRVRPAGKVDP